ncbi:Reverse transcriptase domain [Cinara cedri]|uniref:Reverse transcriptase domain n=1 Tax=Cinara cedri TaxID=506608 RepID=A0A5E4NL81_9HEMI|nr:Reverse transcriptase domain [Cinara cedri]
MNKILDEKVKGYIQYNDRIIQVKFQTKPKNTIVVQVYMPTTNSSEENLIVIGNWNAIVGEENVKHLTGDYGLGNRNDRGERNQVKESRSYSGAAINSDHNLVMMKCNLKFKRIMCKKKMVQWQVKNLRDEKSKNQYTRKDWITAEIVNLIEERRKYKNLNSTKVQKRYRALTNLVIRESKEAKEKYLEENCSDIETLIKTGGREEAYKMVKKFFGQWKEYLEILYEGETLKEIELNEEEKTEEEEYEKDPVMGEEFDKALKNLKNKRAAGTDGIQAELWKEPGKKFKNRLFQIIKDIYAAGEMSKDYVNSIIIPIPKKAAAKKCEEFRTISLLSHASKILTEIIFQRIESKIEQSLTEDQFGFRKNMGTREAILPLRIIKLIIEGSIEGKNHRGRPRLEYIQQIIKDQGCNSYIEMKRKVDDRKEWKMAAN